MIITRGALLISNPGELRADNFCKGVYVDILNYRRLLASAPGGAWEPSEVTTMDRPRASDVRSWVAQAGALDFALIMFTGHGCYSVTHREPQLELRHNEDIRASELTKGIRKSTLILDCCQVPDVGYARAEARIQKFAAISAGRQPNRANCRRRFDDAVRAAVGDIMTVSCSTGEVAYDNDLRGGAYNANMIDVAADWVEGQENSHHSTAGQTLSMASAHESAADRTRNERNGKQNPTITKARTAPYLPFAVFE